MARSRTPLEGIVGWRIEQFASLGITESRGAAFIVVGHWALDAVDRVAGDRVALAEIIEQGRQRREFAPDARRGEYTRLEVFAPGDNVGPSDGAQLSRSPQAGEGGELTDIVAVGAPGFGIGDIGEPFELGWHFGEIAKLGRSEAILVNRDQFVSHVRPYFQCPALIGIPTKKAATIINAITTHDFIS